ncbi:Syg1p [Sugiyamaella lignohabitans]|uniref:Syg1p n=1 Tax=Sugiyamaella lignohabitans TaxID=796027 RepID=A0A167C964_9ASCO|nr:Syg1p [Sugiyamaella lignohabitans]ANB11382.1 Syg1p [Sugiyamaella lignohabitans]
MTWTESGVDVDDDMFSPAKYQALVRYISDNYFLALSVAVTASIVRKISTQSEQRRTDLVPEWRDQYFDYKTGKKRLKKFDKKNEDKVQDSPHTRNFQTLFSGDSEHDDTPDLSSSPHPLTVSQLLRKGTNGKLPLIGKSPNLLRSYDISPSVVSTSSPRLKKPKETKILPGADVARFSSVLPYQSHSGHQVRIADNSFSPAYSGLELPPPAIKDASNPTKVDSISKIGGSGRDEGSSKDENRPDLQGDGPARRKVGFSESDVTPSQRDTGADENLDTIDSDPDHFDAPPVNDRSPLLENPFGPEPMAISKSNKSRQGTQYNTNEVVGNSTSSSNSASMEASTLRNRFTSENNQGAEAVSSNEAAIQELLAWVDSEVEKIEKFYSLKEAEAVEKYLILQDQLIQFNQHRSDIKQALANGEIINRAALTTKEALFREFDMPSLPEMLKKRKKKSMSENEIGGSGSDFSRKPDRGVTFSVARAQLKIALKEYYHSLELLKDYKSLNATAVRKMVKKFDKAAKSNKLPGYLEKIKNCKFVSSDVLDTLIPRTEDLYAFYFESSNHKRAVEKLRATDFPNLHYSAMFTTGLFLGLSVPLFIDGIVAGIRHSSKNPDIAYLFQIWGGFFLANLFVCLFMLNLYTWTTYKINYPFIFEFDQHNYLDYRQYGELPSMMLFLLSLFGWFTFRDFWPEQFPGKYFPPIYLGIALFTILCPLPILHWKARKWLVVAVWRLLLSGAYPVEFRDFFLGDIFCSLNYTISNASMFFCLYGTHWDLLGSSKYCTSSHSRLLGFLNSLPGIWRLLQCLRRYGDTGDWFPHLANGLKYSCLVLYYMFLSLARINRSSKVYHSCFILFACLNAIYSTIWDLFMDFSLLQPNSRHFLLRNELGFGSKWPYYAIMIVDPILRFSWILYAVFWDQIEQSAKISFFVSLIEIVRRFLWAFFRVENEHGSNVNRFRASRDLTLPYSEAKKIRIHSETMADETEHGQGDGTQVPMVDVEAQLRADEPASEEERHTPKPSPQRRKTFASIATPVLQAVSLKLKSAHTADFERRKPDDQQTGSADDDDDDDDDDDSILGDRYNTANENNKD